MQAARTNARMNANVRFPNDSDLAIRVFMFVVTDSFLIQQLYFAVSSSLVP